MINTPIASVKSIGAYNKDTGMVPVVFTLIDKTGADFEFERDVNAATDVNGNLDTLTTSQRCMQILAGLIANCTNGNLSKAKYDERIAQEKANAEAMARAAKQREESEKQAEAMKASVQTTEGTPKVTETK